MKEYVSPEAGIYYRKNDFRPEKETLVFIHGLSGSSSAWLQYEKKFENDYNILTYDLRGHGKSKKYKNYEDYELSYFVRDLEEILNLLQIKKFILISHSFGAMIALKMWREHEQEITSAIFLAPAFNVTKQFGYIIRMAINCGISLAKLFPFKSLSGSHTDYSLFPNTPDYSIRRIYADIHNTCLRVYLFCLKHLYLFKGDHYLPAIKIPTLLIHGKMDKMVPVSCSVEKSKIIKDCEFVLLEKANHILILNNFPEISAIIEKFLY